jgi:two-component system, OmpR family, phosphate regulon sensor histidine kinase PhoR
MKVESIIAWGGWLTAVLAISVCLGIFTLLGFAIRATHQWERSTALLVERDTFESADLLVTAVTRDMRGAQSRVLANRDWGELSIESISDTTDQVATAFARYPYPESFFSWREGNDLGVVFFNRANRYPSWMPQPPEARRYPVAVVTNPPGSEEVRQHIVAAAVGSVRYVAFDLNLAGEPYQVVARLTYADSPRAPLASVVGFTVNLAWVRRGYFSELLSEIAPVATRGTSLDISVLDERGARVWGEENGNPPLVREFPLLFLDPAATQVGLGPSPRVAMWKIRTSHAADSPLIGATEGADRTLLMAGAAAFTLGVGLVLAIRAVRAGVALTAMRSDFVSSVTHELKMPLANIRMLADTLARRPIHGDTIRHYADFLVHEAKRLTRLVDNLLAYARVTDVTEAYSFEPIAPHDLIDDALKNFRHPLAEGGFAVHVDVQDDLPLVRADRTAMLLALDNLLDNAIRYSSDRRSIHLTAGRSGAAVSIEVRDDGAGIPADQLTVVRRKFVRGALANASGSGLGLAIVVRIVSDHHGVFVLESQPGSGTTAKIELPVAGD